MSTPSRSFIQRPKLVIPVAIILALAIGFYLYPSVGKAPVVSITNDSTINTPTGGTSSANNSVALAFPESGRVASVSVKAGDMVTKGETLASLDTGTAEGAVTQAQGALQLAQAQYASMNVQYANAKTQQDTLVANAYSTLLSSGLAAVPSVQDDSHIPAISGTYTCSKEGSYQISTYTSNTTSGFSFIYSGLESGSGPVTFNTPEPLGSCGLYITFVPGFSGATNWTVAIPNTKSSEYVVNENAYNLAVTTRDQTLSQYAANLGQSSSANTSQAAVVAAEGAYQTALANYQNDLIVAPTNGTVSFVSSGLKVGASITQDTPVISITAQ